jgi:hypothetical protein
MKPWVIIETMILSTMIIVPRMSMTMHLMMCYHAIKQLQSKNASFKPHRKPSDSFFIKQKLITEESILKRPFQFSADILNTD